MMEMNLTPGHLAGTLFLSLVLARILEGWLLIRSIIWVFMWQILTPTNEIWVFDLLACFLLFGLLETINFFINSTQQKHNNV